jgi:hypothetical protein
LWIYQIVVRGRAHNGFGTLFDSDTLLRLHVTLPILSNIISLELTDRYYVVSQGLISK